MTISANDMSELRNYTFDGSHIVSLNVQSFVATGSPLDQTSNLVSLTATIGPPSSFQDVDSTYPKQFVVTNPSSFTGEIAMDEYDVINGTPVYASSIVVYVLGFASNAILIASFDNENIAHDLQLGNQTGYELGALIIAPVAQGTQVTFSQDGVYDGPAPCFAHGTRIATARGEVAVEELAEDDIVHGEISAAPRRVRWVGRRTVEVARHRCPWDVAPVRVRADAFAPGRPARDLILSPDHAVHWGAALIPVRYLLNGATIVQERVEQVTYLHVELDRHDVLLAEGLPCESYLDTGNRGAFANGAASVQLHPNFAQRVWDAESCAPLLLRGPALEQARRDLLARAEHLGWQRAADPALRVLADGTALPAACDGARWQVALPAQVRELRFASRAGVPMQMAAAGQDARRLGVALADITLDGRAPPAIWFGAGWHQPEPGWRWTDGDARLLTGGERTLRFVLAMASESWLAPPEAGRARAAA